ncbi:unnamed protein product [Closterium sp. Naga37s-1]|nr:unnamed protein product [Closterium sp. Naga37s-1]
MHGRSLGQNSHLSGSLPRALSRLTTLQEMSAPATPAPPHPPLLPVAPPPPLSAPLPPSSPSHPCFNLTLHPSAPPLTTLSCTASYSTCCLPSHAPSYSHHSLLHLSLLHHSLLHLSLLHLSPLHLSPLHLSPLHLSPLHLSTLHLSPLHLSPLHLSPLHLSPLHLSPLHLSTLHLSPLHLSPLHLSLLRLCHWPPFSSSLLLPFSSSSSLLSFTDISLCPSPSPRSRPLHKLMSLQSHATAYAATLPYEFLLCLPSCASLLFVMPHLPPFPCAPSPFFAHRFIVSRPQHIISPPLSSSPSPPPLHQHTRRHGHFRRAASLPHRPHTSHQPVRRPHPSASPPSVPLSSPPLAPLSPLCTLCVIRISQIPTSCHIYFLPYLLPVISTSCHISFLPYLLPAISPSCHISFLPYLLPAISTSFHLNLLPSQPSAILFNLTNAACFNPHPPSHSVIAFRFLFSFSPPPFCPQTFSGCSGAAAAGVGVGVGGMEVEEGEEREGAVGGGFDSFPPRIPPPNFLLPALSDISPPAAPMLNRSPACPHIPLADILRATNGWAEGRRVGGGRWSDVYRGEWVEEGDGGNGEKHGGKDEGKETEGIGKMKRQGGEVSGRAKGKREGSDKGGGSQGKQLSGTKVWKGGRPGDNWAVKRMRGGAHGAERAEFEAHVAGLAPLGHPNVLALVGWCCCPVEKEGVGGAEAEGEGGEKEARVWGESKVAAGGSGREGGNEVVLVYKWMERGSLEAALQPGATPLSLQQRVGIAVGVLRALKAVQSHGQVHGDLKPSNVLLGASYEPRVADWSVRGGAAATAAHLPPPPPPHPACVPILPASVGVLLLQLLTGWAGPFRDVDGQRTHIYPWVRPTAPNSRPFRSSLLDRVKSGDREGGECGEGEKGEGGEKGEKGEGEGGKERGEWERGEEEGRGEGEGGEKGEDVGECVRVESGGRRSGVSIEESSEGAGRWSGGSALGARLAMLGAVDSREYVV